MVYFYQLYFTNDLYQIEHYKPEHYWVDFTRKLLETHYQLVLRQL